MLSTDDVHMSSQIDFTMCSAGLFVALLILFVFGILCAIIQNHVSDIQPLIVNTYYTRNLLVIQGPVCWETVKWDSPWEWRVLVELPRVHLCTLVSPKGWHWMSGVVVVWCCCCKTSVSHLVTLLWYSLCHLSVHPLFVCVLMSACTFRRSWHCTNPSAWRCCNCFLLRLQVWK